MDEKMREEVAQMRYALIAPIVKRVSFQHGELAPLLRQIASGTYENIPYSNGNVSFRTLERYLSLYREGGFEALKPAKRGRTSRIPHEYFDKCCALRRENPTRSIEMIINLLEESGKVPKGILKKSTVYDHLTKHGLTRKQTGAKSGRFTRYGASYRGEILQGDVHHTLKLPDPNSTSGVKQVYLFAWIDDYSRLVYGQFYFAERLPALEDCLKKWIIRHGQPEIIYTDNGAVYSSHHLKNICGYLGIQLTHSKPYRPQGRGKIEKFFQFVESSFKSEVELLIKDGKISTLKELNNLFFIWMDKFYNQRVHSSTKQKPVSRWEGCDHKLKHPSLEDIRKAFLLKGTRSVTKIGTISLEGNEYEVEPFLCGKKITVRFDPYDLSQGIMAFFEGRQFKDAVPVKVRRHSKKGFETTAAEMEISTGINFLEQLAGEKFAKKESVNFSKLCKE